MYLSLIENIKLKTAKHFPALANSNFRIFWFGQIISLIGTWMQTISLPWLSYSLTKSPFLVGLVGAVQFTPMLILSLFVGVLNDKLDKKSILKITQSVLALCAMILSILVFTKKVEYWHILIIAGTIGLSNAFDMPTRQAFIIDMVGRESLMNAIALNSAVFNTARIIGPTIAGIVMAAAGMGFCFLFNSLSFIPVIIGLFFITPYYKPNEHLKNNNIIKNIGLGLKYICSEKILFWTLLGVLIVGAFGMNFNVLVPVFAKTVLKLNEKGFGVLMSCMGLGSLLGALTVASRSKKGPKVIVLTIASICTSLIFISIGFNKNFILTALLLALLGFSNTFFFTTSNTTLQLNSKDEYRGRVVSVYTLFFGGSTPIGNLFAGSISGYFGAGAGFTISGAVILFFIFLLFIVNRISSK